MNTMLLTNFYIAEAARWYRLAADQGYGPAKYALGEMYAEGRGVRKDYVLAHMWLNLAAAQSYPLSTNLKVFYESKRAMVEGQMNPEQITKAQRLAQTWKPKSK